MKILMQKSLAIDKKQAQVNDDKCGLFSLLFLLLVTPQQRIQLERKPKHWRDDFKYQVFQYQVTIVSINPKQIQIVSVLVIVKSKKSLWILDERSYWQDKGIDLEWVHKYLDAIPSSLKNNTLIVELKPRKMWKSKLLLQVPIHE